MNDFIFGTLATDELRLAHERAVRAGISHQQVRMPRDPLPGQAVQVKLSIGPGQPYDRAWVCWTTDGSDPGPNLSDPETRNRLPMESVGSEWDTLLWGYRHQFSAVIPRQPEGTLVRYCLAAGNESGPLQPADLGKIYAYYVADDPLPPWTTDAVVYQIFVDRFFPGRGRNLLQPETPAGFYGGSLAGITEKLDYITDLGVNVLWLTPIFPSPSHHGYDATDYFDIEPRLGTKSELRKLLDEAHSRGIRFLLDFVPNHWSSRHPTFQAALADPESPYVGWYNFEHWPDRYESFFGVADLPQVNLRYPPARQYMLDAAAYWLEFGVDGYRLDYAIGPAQEFWAEFRKTTRSIRPECWTFGEVVEPSDSQLNFSGLLDGCLDFILLEALRQTFAYGRWDAAQLASFLERHEAYFPADFSRPSFLDNHDMNRFLWAAGGDQRRLRMAALCQFTLTGPPVIYYGTEVGLSQVRDVRQDGRGLPEESRLPMLWGRDQDQELLAFYRQLIGLRRSEPALRRGKRHSLHAQGPILAYQIALELADPGTASDLIAVFNLGETAQTFILEGQQFRLALATVTDCRIKKLDQNQSEVALPGLSAVLLRTTH